MRHSTQLKLAEVEASYRTARPAAHRCGLISCQEDGECAFPTRCVALSSDMSSDECIQPSADWQPVDTDDMLDPMDPGEYAWRAEGRDNGWKPPKRRPWWQRLWVIRHVSALWLSWQVHTYAGAWVNVGIGVGSPHPHDLWVVEGAYYGYW